MQTSPRALRLAMGFACLVVLTTLLIVLGALVRAHGAGLACPDWPLCFGEAIPQFDVKIAFEWGHRVMAGGIGLLFLGLAIGILSHPPLRTVLGRTTVLAGAVLALQILLGALTVWELLAQWTVTSHLLTGNFFNALLLWLALGLRQAARPPTHPRPSAGLRMGVGIAAFLLFLQMAIGGLVSSGYAGLACPEWPTCNGGYWFPAWRGSVGIHLAHRMNGYLLLLTLVGVAWACRRQPVLGLRFGITALLGIFQVVVGILNVVLGIPVEVTGLHSALAACLVLGIAACLHACYNAAPEATPAAPHEEVPQ